MEECKPDIFERFAAAFVLAGLAEEFPYIQDILLANLNIELLESNKHDLSYNAELLEIIERVRNAKCKLVAMLTAINERNLFWNADSVFDYLQHPHPEAIPLLIQSLTKLDERAKSAILKVLGTVELPSKEIIDLLEIYLKNRNNYLRNAAADALGNLKEPAINDEREQNAKVIQIFDMLMESIQNTLAAAVAIGNYAERIAQLEVEIAREKLSEAVKVLAHVIYTTSQFEFAVAVGLGGSSFDKVTEALSKVVVQLTIVKLKNISLTLPSDLWLGTSAVKPHLRPKYRSRNIQWRLASIITLIAVAFYMALWALIPNLIASFIPTAKVGSITRSVLVLGFILLSFLAAWLWLRDNQE